MSITRFLLLATLSSAPAFPPSLSAQDEAYDSQALSAAVDSSTSDFSNASMYSDTSSWTGRLIAISGKIAEVPVIGHRGNSFLQISGNGAHGVINVVTYIDSPLPSTESYTGQVPLITKGQDVRVLARVMGTEDFYDPSGYTLHLPTLDCLAIYFSGDPGLVRPIWTAQQYRK